MNTVDHIEVRYKCACMDKEAAVLIPPRLPDEDIVEWMTRPVGYCVYLDHRVRSPACKQRTMEYVMLPMSGTERIGGAPEVN